MYLYIELWNVTQKWMDLSKEERRSYLSKVRTGMKELTDAGVENVGWAMNDEHTPHRSDYYYMAVWKMPSREYAEKLEKAVSDAGWHDYFSQVNSRGEIVPLDQTMEKLVDLKSSATGIKEGG